MSIFKSGGIISTHAPYTEGDYGRSYALVYQDISTHAPYTEGDKKAAKGTQITDISTHAPYTEGDWIVDDRCVKTIISTHAPYTEGDLLRLLLTAFLRYFNSRPLYRGRQQKTGNIAQFFAS